MGAWELDKKFAWENVVKEHNVMWFRGNRFEIIIWEPGWKCDGKSVLWGIRRRTGEPLAWITMNNPGHAYEGYWSTMNTPGHVYEGCWSTINTPGHANERCWSTMNTPGHAFMRGAGVPWTLLDTPMRGAGPWTLLDTPMRGAVVPWRPLDTPMRGAGVPWTPLDTPL